MAQNIKPKKILEKLKEVLIENYSEKITNLPFEKWDSTSSNTQGDFEWHRN